MSYGGLAKVSPVRLDREQPVHVSAGTDLGSTPI